MEKTCTPGDGSTTQALLPYGHCIFKPEHGRSPCLDRGYPIRGGRHITNKGGGGRGIMLLSLSPASLPHVLVFLFRCPTLPCACPPPGPMLSLASSCVYATLPSSTLLMPVPLLIPPVLLFRACRFVLYSYTLIQSQHTTVKGKDKYQYPLSVEYLPDKMGVRSLLLFLDISLAFLVFVLIN